MRALEGLTLVQQAVAVLFVLGVAATYAVALPTALSALARRLRRADRPPMRPLEARVRAGSLGLAALGLACFAWALLVEPNWLEVTRVQLESPKVRRGAAPLRIVHVSDLHSDPEPRLEDDVASVVERLEPDLIVFTGDAINSPDGLPAFRDCMARLAAVAPTFAVRGNWDVLAWGDIDLFKGTGVRELDREAVRVPLPGVNLWVSGTPDGAESDLPKALSEIPRGAFVVHAAHSPDIAPLAAERAVDLVLAGHSHGGQIALPWYGALITLCETGKRFESGLRRVANTDVFVTRGVGMEGGLPRVRFCARPEVAVIEVAPAR